jgi:succinyl-diaminopimelate desuccinylase
VDNLFARRGTGRPHFGFAGHVDVVPPGDSASWTDDPFAGVVRDGRLFGRGACDMKGAIAAFVAAAADFLADNDQVRGSVSLVITGDEEGPAINGTARVLEWLRATDQLPDMMVVGEPTSRTVLGDTIKIGRRGSLTAWITAHGRQGHSAYPAAADNPVHRLMSALLPLLSAPLDPGSAHFPPSSVQVTGFDVGNPVSNVIPGSASAMLNIRFNDHHTSAALIERIRAGLLAAGVKYNLHTECSGESFLTQPGPLVDMLSNAISRTVGITPQLDTGGGTSDARFIARYCPVAELGPLSTSAHQIDEYTNLADLRQLVAVYRAVLENALA